MKVLQINTVCGTGSTGRIATDLYDILNSNGYDCCIAYGRGQSPDKYKTIRIGNDLDVYRHALYTRITDKTGFGSKRSTLKLIERIKEYDPDVIHLHNIHGYHINIEILFDYLSVYDGKVVWTLHDCWAFTGHCAYFDFIGCDKWKTQCYKCPQKKTYPSSYLMDSSSFNYIKKKELFTSVKDMIIVTPSKWLAGLVKESFLQNYPVEVIHNGIDLDIFKPTKCDFRKIYGLENKFIILGVASVWSKRKGLEEFIRLSEMISEDMKIVIIGLTKKQTKKLPSKILGITRINNVTDLAGLYAEADVFVNPTFEDNFPTTNLEALACGTPVITYDTGGSVESVDENTGVIVEKGDLKDVLRIISKLKQSTNSDNALYKRNRVIDIFDKKKRFNDYIQLYNKQEKG